VANKYTTCRGGRAALAQSGDRVLRSIAAELTRDATTIGAVIREHLDRIQPGDYFGLLAYIPMFAPHEATLQQIRKDVLESKQVATVLGFGLLGSSRQARPAQAQAVDRVAVVLRSFDAANQGDLDTALAQFADNAVFIGSRPTGNCSPQAPCTDLAGIQAAQAATAAWLAGLLTRLKFVGAADDSAGYRGALGRRQGRYRDWLMVQGHTHVPAAVPGDGGRSGGQLTTAGAVIGVAAVAAVASYDHAYDGRRVLVEKCGELLRREDPVALGHELTDLLPIGVVGEPHHDAITAASRRKERVAIGQQRLTIVGVDT